MDKTYSYLSFFQKLYQGQKRISAEELSTIEDISAWSQKLHCELKGLLGLYQLEQYRENYRCSHLRIEELDQVQEDGYLRKKYRIETLPQVSMPFYLLIPDSMNEKEKHRTMIALPAHGANKDTVAGVISGIEVKKKLIKSPKESYGREFVKRGYVVLCPDPPGYGERIEPLPQEDRAFLPELRSSVLDSSCKNLAQTAEALGLSFQGLYLWDMMCLLDFAFSQPYIDNERIGCAGFSGGGLYTMWLAAMDERVKLAVISGYIHGFYDSILDTHLCPCNYMPGLWGKADISDIAAMIAPRALFMENGYQDILNGRRGILDPEEQAERIQKIYRIYGKDQQINFRPFNGIHEWYGGCYEFVDLNL